MWNPPLFNKLDSNIVSIHFLIVLRLVNRETVLFLHRMYFTFVFLYLQEVQAFPVSQQVQQAQGDPEEWNEINTFQNNDFIYVLYLVNN